MSVRLPSIQPLQDYDFRNESEYRESIRQGLLRAHDTSQALPLVSPNGSVFFLTVNDAGQIALFSPDGSAIDATTGATIDVDLGTFTDPTQGTSFDGGGL